ncbi:OmpA family protein [Franzmannia qiaohouensis]|uniref:OmpA family protein n=1 Tax=Franzmannia qiaohouensis TaxID=1329370 RepID=A0ABU1HBY0_9GAMM|nr:OmpA family protein [Halomonas qiaohouensis]MDR5904797.1 OmpA family protein [Halomonas qiaohouensis]
MLYHTAKLLLVALIAMSPQTQAIAEDVDLLDETDVPDSAEIAASISSLAIDIRRIEIPPPARLEIPAPRSLRVDVEDDDQTTITLSADVLFAFDEDALNARSEQIVQTIADEKLLDTEGPIQVVGHTDSIGDDAYNQGLSERRAAAVAAALREVLGASREIEEDGRSFHEPVAENTLPNGDDNPEGRTQNRRVEIIFDKE